MLRRTNPQAYEWYKNYYGMMQQQQQQQGPVPGAMDDIGGSLRSGYSSSNEKDRLDTIFIKSTKNFLINTIFCFLLTAFLSALILLCVPFVVYF